MQLLPDGELTRLIDLPDGCLFQYGDEKVALKTRYLDTKKRVDAFEVGSGEFVGGLSSPDPAEVNELLVQPLKIVKTK